MFRLICFGLYMVFIYHPLARDIDMNFFEYIGLGVGTFLVVGFVIRAQSAPQGNINYYDDNGNP